MRKIDAEGLQLCRYQAELFEQSRDKADCSTNVFLRRFMLSDLAKRMDQDSFLFENLSLDDAMMEIERQFGYSQYGNEKYSAEELYWIGYLYRYWLYTRDRGSYIGW